MDDEKDIQLIEAEKFWTGDLRRLILKVIHCTENVDIRENNLLQIGCDQSEDYIGSRNGLAPIWCQAISESKADKDLWRKYAELDLNELRVR